MAFVSLGMATLATALLVAGRIDVTPTDDLWMVLENAQPGDEIVIHAGTYNMDGLRQFAFAGTETDPIVVRAEDGDEVLIEGISDQNTLNVEGTHYTIRGLKIHGGSHGIRVGTSTRALFEDLEIWGTGDVGFSCNLETNVYDTITIRRVHIHDTAGTGECMYLGCNDDKCQMFDSLVEFNWCHDTLAGTQGDGIELKTGSYGNVILHNVIHDVKFPVIAIYASVVPMPAINVEGNVVWSTDRKSVV